MKSHTSAILVFAQSASRDAAAKKLPGGAPIFDQLTRQTLEKAKRTGLPLFHYDEAKQEGTTFQQRLSNAIRSLFDSGVESLVVIGNDSPDLTSRSLREAATAAQNKRAVLGPANDGGVYLIGIHKDHFDYGEFLHLPWRQESLFQEMASWIASRSRQEVLVFDSKMDLDTTGDFLNWSANPGPFHRRLAHLIIGFLCKKPIVFFQRPSLFAADYYPFTRFNKGSPVLSC